MRLGMLTSFEIGIASSHHLDRKHRHARMNLQKGKKNCHVHVFRCDIFAMMKKLTFHANTESRMWSKLRAFHLSTDCKFFICFYKLVHVLMESKLT